MPSSNPNSPCAEAIAFGPVPSRRLGSSVGVNTVPCKTCTYSCVYCQLGRTALLSVERRTFRETHFVAESVLDRISKASHRPDYVTFLGCGEPTLASNMGDILREIAGSTDCRKALLTNGALLWNPNVRQEAKKFDVVLPTIAAGNEGLFRKIHRPHPSLNLQKVLSGMMKFSREAAGEVWVEVMLVAGINDDGVSLEGIRRAIGPLNANKIHITAPTRPPAELWVRCPNRESIELALVKIPGAIDMNEPETGQFDISKRQMIDDLLAIAMIHPLTEVQILGALTSIGMTAEEARQTVEKLRTDSRIEQIVHGGTVFYRTNR
ncbi:MAG: radical SAM protein [Thermoplasmata archaeon]